MRLRVARLTTCTCCAKTHLMTKLGANSFCFHHNPISVYTCTSYVAVNSVIPSVTGGNSHLYKCDTVLPINAYSFKYIGYLF